MRFFFNDTATTEIYTLSLHDALPIFDVLAVVKLHLLYDIDVLSFGFLEPRQDRKSTRLNSSHGYISYAVFCLKKKNAIQSILNHLLGIDRRANKTTDLATCIYRGPHH